MFSEEIFGRKAEPLPELKPGWEERIPARFDLRSGPQLIDRGSTCRVYKCAVGDALEPRALKAIPLRDAPNAMRRVSDEIDAGKAAAGCENVVHLFDWEVDPDNGEAFLLEEYCQPLREYRRTRPLDKKEVFRLGMHICDALEQCQERGVAHLDVQPRNIFIGADGRYKLGDFSSALLLTQLPGEEALRGTLAFMAPEVYHHREYSIRSDLYSLALVLYCLLNDNRPPFVFGCGSDAGIQSRLEGETLPPVRDAGDTFNFGRRRALAPNPSERFANPVEMRNWLSRCMMEALNDDVRPLCDAPALRQSASPKEAGSSSSRPEARDEFDSAALATTVPEIHAKSFPSSEAPPGVFGAAPSFGPEDVPDPLDFEAKLPRGASALGSLFRRRKRRGSGGDSPDFTEPSPPWQPQADGDPFGAADRCVGGDAFAPPNDLDASPSFRLELRSHRNPLSILASPLFAIGSGLIFIGESLSEKLLERRQRSKAKGDEPHAPASPSRPEPQPEQAADSTPPADAIQAPRTADEQPAPSPAAQPVQFSAVAPKRFQRESYTMLDVFMYEDAARAVVEQALAEGGGEMAESRSGRLMAANGTHVRVVLVSPDLALTDCDESGVWAGDHLRFSFAIWLPGEYAKAQILFNALIYFDGVLVTRLKFIANCASDSEQRPEVARQDIRSAFISYSSRDRGQVASVVQGMKKVRPDMDIFWDLDSLHSGDYWDLAIKQEIDARDVLYLCWSHFARESKHVEDEWRYALDRKGLNFIEPIPFEPSELCPPPEELASKHFNDRLLYFTLHSRGSAP